MDRHVLARGLYSGVIYDALHFDFKIPRNQIMLSGNGKFKRNFSACVFGKAFPAVGMKATKLDLDKVNDMLDSIPKGSVYILQSNTNTVATFGDITSKFMENRYCSGAVINGYIRDLRKISLPTAYLGTCSADAYDYWDINSYGMEIFFDNRVIICPTDYIFMDETDILLIPGNIIDDVLYEATERKRTEDRIRKFIIKENPSAKTVKEKIGRW